jgi:hypothetical protein
VDETPHKAYAVLFHEGVSQQVLRRCAGLLQDRWRSRQPPADVDWGLDFGQIDCDANAFLVLMYSGGKGKSFNLVYADVMRYIGKESTAWDLRVLDVTPGQGSSLNSQPLKRGASQNSQLSTWLASTDLQAAIDSLSGSDLEKLAEAVRCSTEKKISRSGGCAAA